MKNTEKKNYTPPTLTVVRFKTERGFASSGTLLDQLEFTFWNSDNGSDQMESYSTGNGWNEGSNHFWD